ncbi:Hypothetical protein R9X50_00523900 [Acrodontium crateriforme]|uniref:Uncharacterized protein n=1 Tax=Acrodontium crateriforme TaxID=150365 RepID=A0AAQ3R5R7_9PEZI|nr:Hypothetical protein R9X50_00523900 [Acrodontium crateriforme]
MALLWQRQSFGDDDGLYGDDDGIRYAIFGTLFGLIILYLCVGYFHAQRRLRAGQAPLRYHRWMTARSYNTYYPQARYNNYNAYQYHINPNGQGYAMDGYPPPPPPAYNHAEAPPPVYQPPQGGSKVAADQAYVRPQMERVGESSGPAPLSAAARQ